MIGYAICGSFCTHQKSLDVLSKLKLLYEDILPIVSFNTATIDTRFGKACEYLNKIEEITGVSPIKTIEDAEPIGPKIALELLIIAPCTGNTLAKIANGITDTPVTMAAKAHLRSNRPLLIALASNDAMGANLNNIGTLLNRKNIYFTPMFQDDIVKKPHSLVADFDKILTSAKDAINATQTRPVFLC